MFLQIFVWIMCCTIVLCVVHSLVIIPAIFSVIEIVRRRRCTVNGSPRQENTGGEKEGKPEISVVGVGS